MGQDCSWPCSAKRKEQEKRLMQSKYHPDTSVDEEFREMDKIDKKNERLYNLDKIQEIIERKSYTSTLKKESTEAEWKPKSSQPHSPTHSAGTQSQSVFTFTDDSAVVENELPLIFIVEEIEKIDSFLRKISEKYGDMILSMIIPHPSKQKSIAMFQSTNLISNVTSGKQHKFYDLVKDLRNENKNNAYQIIVTFLKQKYDEGLEYLGYYLDKEAKYHFIFSERTEKSTERTNLDFFTLSDMSQTGIHNTLNKAIKEHYKMKGVITVSENKDSSNSLSFLILEKRKVNINQYFLVSIAGETFDTNGPNLDFSRKIELGCQSDELDVAGLIVHHQDNSMFLVFSK